MIGALHPLDPPSPPEHAIQAVTRQLAAAVDQLRTLTGGREWLLPEPVQRPDDGDEAAHVRAYLRARRLRERFMPADLFGEPAWDMLLDLYACGIEGRPVSISSACIAAAVPPTTALRWIGKLSEHGLIERRVDPADARRCHVELSRKGAVAIRAWLDLTLNAAANPHLDTSLSLCGTVSNQQGSGRLNVGGRR